MFSSRPPRGSRCKRTKYNKNQLKVLVEAFEKEPYLNPTKREELAKRIQIPESRIQVWFQNHRARTPKHFQRPCGKAAVAPGSRQGGFYAPPHCSGLQGLLSNCDSNRTLQSDAGRFSWGLGGLPSQAVFSGHMKGETCDLETPARALGKPGSFHHSLSSGFSLAALGLPPDPLRQPFSQVEAGGTGIHQGDPRLLMAQGCWALHGCGQPPPSEWQPWGGWQPTPALEPLTQHPRAQEQPPLPPLPWSQDLSGRPRALWRPPPAGALEAATTASSGNGPSE